MTVAAVPPLAFLDTLLWLDGRPLVLEPYRRRLFEAAFSLGPDGLSIYSMILSGRSKKNGKTLDLDLAGAYSLLFRDSPQGSDCFLLANDEDQAEDDLDLLKKLVRANPRVEAELTIRTKWIERKDDRGVLRVLPARDVAGAHGKTGVFIGWDEIHEYRDYSLLEALSPDPTRRAALTWITSYDSLWHVPGRPLYDLVQRGKRGDDPRMLFSWYSGTYTTDPEFAGEDVTPEQRANPSMGSWTNPHYLEEQKRRLPSHKYRRLHLNIGGQPEGAFYSSERILGAVVEGRRSLPFVAGRRYFAFVDMSGGSSDDATLAIAHREEDGRAVLDLVVDQGPRPPFDPRLAVKKFAGLLREYGISRVTGDAYAGQTFRADFQGQQQIAYEVAAGSTSDRYQRFEPRLNAGEVELLDEPKLVEQLTGLVMRGGKVTHLAGDHDDWAASVSGCLNLAADLQAQHATGGMFDRFRGEPISGWWPAPWGGEVEYRDRSVWNGIVPRHTDSAGRHLPPWARIVEGRIVGYVEAPKEKPCTS